VVNGALQALSADSDLVLTLVGPHELAGAIRHDLDRGLRARVEVLAAPHSVAMSDPVARGADLQTSIGAAVSALAHGHADGLVSAGASGAIVAAAVMGLRRQHGVRRPALTAVLPGVNGPLVLLDVGAGMQVSPVELVQHASLGAAYARLAVGIAQPRVGLLSVGHEPGKGDRLRRAADAALRVHTMPGAAYVGLVEGHDVVLGARANVIITDGFTGNVLLKGIEAALAIASSHVPPIAVPRAAALLGVAGTVVVCHGAAAADDLASGIALAVSLVRAGVAQHLAVATRDAADGVAADRVAEAVS
jgi:glycerol-3-phosphate acyltransferase PlsX